MCIKWKRLIEFNKMMQIQGTALELFIIKNADYGDAFAKYGVNFVR